MISRVFAIMTAALVLCGVASAQSYSIRVEFNTNLREEHSLDSHVVESAPAGSILQVVDSFNRWLKINRSGREVWMASWVSHSRVAESGQTASQPASNVPAQVDNCCFVDRQCHSAQDWENGYWAYQNGQCAAPAQPQPQIPAQPVSSVPAQVDNCCFVDRQCNTDADWAEGYHAFQDNQCAAPAGSQPQTSAQPVSSVPAQVDNCCFVDRQCNTAADWENGFYAFRDNQCAAPAGSQPQTSAQPVSNVSEPIDNCCLVNRQCHSEGDWEQGFYAYLAGECPVAGGAPRVAWTPNMTEGVKQFLANPSSDPFNNCCYMHHNTCHSSGDWERGRKDYQKHECLHPAPLWTLPTIVDNGTPVGSARFTDLVNTALDLIRIHAPEWLRYIQLSGVRQIELIPGKLTAGFWNQRWLTGLGYWSEQQTDPNWVPDINYVLEYVDGITHEACHAIKQRTYTQTAGWANEVPCLEAGSAAVEAIRPHARGFRWPRT